jgi:hypothetical protein
MSDGFAKGTYLERVKSDMAPSTPVLINTTVPELCFPEDRQSPRGVGSTSRFRLRPATLVNRRIPYDIPSAGCVAHWTVSHILARPHCQQFAPRRGTAWSTRATLDFPCVYNITGPVYQTCFPQFLVRFQDEVADPRDAASGCARPICIRVPEPCTLSGIPFARGLVSTRGPGCRANFQ